MRAPLTVVQVWDETAVAVRGYFGGVGFDELHGGREAGDLAFRVCGVAPAMRVDRRPINPKSLTSVTPHHSWMTTTPGSFTGEPNKYPVKLSLPKVISVIAARVLHGTVQGL